MNRVVLDASVVLKWFLTDEEHGAKALNLLGRYTSNELDILAPSLLEYEVLNGLTIAKKRGRINEETILTATEGFLSLDIKVLNLSQIYNKVFHYCKIFHRSAYDASYLAAADEMGLPLITADEALYREVKKELKWVKWLGDI